MQIFLDMDGVLADFDTGYERAFGVRPSKADDNVDWELVRKTPGFYANLPLMPGALELLKFVQQHSRFNQALVLTGVPWSVPEAPDEKRAFANKLPGSVRVITCPSKEKYKFCVPGDTLVDDWEKYMPLWIAAGGNWITHISAESSIAQLRTLLNAS